MLAVENFEATQVAAPGKPKGTLKRCIVICVFLLAAAVAGLGVFVAHTFFQRNFRVVSEGRLYRSGQMDVEGLTRVIREHGIRTVVNLRGPAEGVKGEWYFAETNASQLLGVEHIDFSLLAGREVSDEEMDDILSTIAHAPKPILIHCKSGSDRTGLIGALYLYSLEGKSAHASVRELSLFCGHVPYLFWRDTIAMDRSFWRYVKVHGQTNKSELSRADSPSVASADSQN